LKEIVPTLEEIAQLCGVSRSTVSRVINNDRRVNAETRRRVQQVIRQHNFRPNAVARSLAGGRTGVLGLVIPMGIGRLFSDPYFPLLIQGVATSCNTHDHSVMLWMAEPEFERRTIHQILNNRLIDGIIVASAVIDDPILTAIEGSDLPFVMVGRHLQRTDVSYIDVDNRDASREVIAFLIRLGFQRIATISGPQNMIAGIDRFLGYQDALHDWRIPLNPDLVVEGDFSEEGGYHAMQRLLPYHPEAIYAASDAMALGALRFLTEVHVNVPADVSIIGFDDIPAAARSAPPLTTVRQPIVRAGAMAAENLIDLIMYPGQGPRRVILPTELVIRDSCLSAANAPGSSVASNSLSDKFASTG
jgi:LacI family transcriptional regulator